MEKRLKLALTGTFVLVLLYGIYLTRENLPEYILILLGSLFLSGCIVLVSWLMDKIKKGRIKNKG